MTPEYSVEEVILKIEGLGVRYDRPILADVNAEVRNIVRPGMSQGQVIALLGPSGIGKTQLFRCMAGLQTPNTGVVTVTDKAIPVKSGMVGVVPQKYPLFEHRTAEGNLLLAARIKHEKGKARELVEGMLQRFGLTEHVRKYPGQLSGGQRQRIAIAQQLLCSGHFLLMDEPFSGLDPIMKDAACSLITEVASADELNTIIVVTHDIESAVCIADTIWLIGRNYDESGKMIGANIRKTYNLIERGLAWQPDVHSLPEFAEFVRELRAEFRTL